MLLPHDDRCRSPSFLGKRFDPEMNTMRWTMEVRSPYSPVGTQRLEELILVGATGELTASIQQTAFDTGDSGDENHD